MFLLFFGEIPPDYILMLPKVKSLIVKFRDLALIEKAALLLFFKEILFEQKTHKTSQILFIFSETMRSFIDLYLKNVHTKSKILSLLLQ